MTARSRHLAALGAQPRPAGGRATDATRDYCASVLATTGFTTRRLPFEYSRFPGAWATPIAGVFVPACATALLAVRDRGFVAVLIVASILLGGVIVLGVVGARGVLSFPFFRARAVNLEAIRGVPRVWLVAHIDSKWQPVSMRARIVGVVGSSVAMLVFALLAVSGAPAGLTTVWLILLWVFSIPLMLSVVGARNDGTLDNASGVATVLAAVDLLPRELPLGVVVTDAEELALAGAAAWARDRAAGTAINVDSIDDDGDLVAMYSGIAPAAIVSALRAAAGSEGERLRVIRLIPGILTDHVPLRAAGWSTLTLSRGTIRTLMRIHTSRDTLSYMDGRGIDGAARVLARTVTELS